MNRKPRVAWIDSDNTSFSQLSEALAKWYGGDVIESFSAGIEPADEIDPEAVTAMQDIYQVDISEYQAKGWTELSDIDILIVLEESIELPPELSATYVEQWSLEEVSDELGIANTIDVLAEKVRYLIDLIIRGRYPIE